jgi:hypothetical protein
MTRKKVKFLTFYAECYIQRLQNDKCKQLMLPSIRCLTLYRSLVPRDIFYHVMQTAIIAGAMKKNTYFENDMKASVGRSL